ncbi:hypothetical protein Tco_0860976 [Tanacetum coccineum]|uniref:TRF2/HOY1 PH-like domain-containing protein n=1 Tax=Tanacetum coccineum TaxID=301880 RepID=A0ABQ5BKK0_9ASTR
MESNGGDNQNHSSDNNQQEYHQHQRIRLNEYPLHAYHQTGFNGDTMRYLLSGSNEKNRQARGVHLQTSYKNSVTEVGESSNRIIIDQQVEESPIGLSLSKSTPVVNQSQTSNKQKRKKELIASEESKLKAVNFSATSIQIGHWVKEAKNAGDVVVKFYYGKKKLVWEFLYGSLKKKMEIQWSQVSAIKTFDDEHLNGYLVLELSEPPEFSEEYDFTAKTHTKWRKTGDDFTGGQASTYSASIHATNNGNHLGEFIHYVPNVVQPSGCFVGLVYPNIPSPALNQIARRGSYETPGTNGVTPPTLNQIATRDLYETPGTNDVYTSALNQIATSDLYETPGTNGVYIPALNQIATRDLYETPGTNGVYTSALNQIATSDLYETPGTNGVYIPALNQIATRDTYETPGTNGVYTPALNQIATTDTYETPGTNGVYTPALNQIATRDTYETPGTNGVYTPALNQIATRDTYETPGTTGVYTPALNQIATRDTYETPGTNDVYTPALNQIGTRDLYKTQGTNGVWVQRGNNGNQEISFTPKRDDEDITDLETETLPQYTNEQTFLNDNQTNKPSDQSYLMNPNTHHQNFEDSSMLPVGAVIPMVDSGIGGSQATNYLECLDEHDIALLESFTNIDDLINCDDAANGNDFEDAFKTSDGNVFPPEP